MTKLFYLSEVVKFAIEKEKESIALYKKLAENVNSKAEKAMFHLLMQEEKNHEDFYTKLLNTVPKEQSAGVEENAEYEAYMQEMIAASRSVSTLSLDKLIDIKVALDYAAAREKDSILFYVGLKNHLPAPDQSKIDTIIKEEAKHMGKLLLLKKTYR